MNRLYVEKFDVHQQYLLSPSHFHYLCHVLRLKPGDRILVFNSHQGEWLTCLESHKKKQASLSFQHQTRPSPLTKIEIHLFFALIKPSRLEILLEKATELGVTHLHPCLTQRSLSRHLNHLRLDRLLIEATEQSYRLAPPTLHPCQPLDQALKEWAFPLFICDVKEKTPFLIFLLNSTPLKDTKAVGIAVGPEGGFTPKEYTTLKTMPQSYSVTLSPQVLRAETAALTALSCFQELI